MIAANGRRRDWVAGNTATLYLEPHASAATLVEKADSEGRQTHLWSSEVDLTSGDTHTLSGLVKTAAKISSGWDDGGIDQLRRCRFTSLMSGLQRHKGGTC